MKIKLITIGANPPAWVQAGYTEYAKRLSATHSLELIEIPLKKRSKNCDLPRLQQQEGAAMLQKIGKDDWVIALERQGLPWSTTELAANLQHWQQQAKVLSLLVGGPEGLAPHCLARADSQWSLSPLTFPHPLVRVILAEQLYRAFSLLAGHPYHK